MEEYPVPLHVSLVVLEGGPALLKSLLYSWMPADMRYFNSFSGRFMTLKGQDEMIAGSIELGTGDLEGVQKNCNNFSWFYNDQMA